MRSSLSHPSVKARNCKGARGCGLRDGLPPGGGPTAFDIYALPDRNGPERLGPRATLTAIHPPSVTLGSWAPKARIDGMGCRPSGAEGGRRAGGMAMLKVPRKVPGPLVGAHTRNGTRKAAENRGKGRDLDHHRVNGESRG